MAVEPLARALRLDGPARRFRGEGGRGPGGGITRRPSPAAASRGSSRDGSWAWRGRKLSIAISTMPTEMALSATLNEGQWWMPTKTSRKSVTAPLDTRSIRLPTAPPTTSARATSRTRSRDGRVPEVEADRHQGAEAEEGQQPAPAAAAVRGEEAEGDAGVAHVGQVEEPGDHRLRSSGGGGGPPPATWSTGRARSRRARRAGSGACAAGRPASAGSAAGLDDRCHCQRLSS